MSVFISQIGAVFDASITWMTQLLGLIMANPPLTTICVALPICSYVCNLLNRLIRL